MAISRDTVGLTKQGRSAAQLNHDAAIVLGDAELYLEMAELYFKLWELRQKKRMKAKLWKERMEEMRTWNLAPASKRGQKPGDVKEADIKDAVMGLKLYREWRTVLAELKSLKTKADKAYFGPSDRRCHLIMNLSKLVTRESPN